MKKDLIGATIAGYCALWLVGKAVTEASENYKNVYYFVTMH